MTISRSLLDVTATRGDLFEGDVRVESKQRIADGVVVLTLRAVGGHTLPGWTPGAHIDLLLPGPLVRQYSLCGDPDDRHCWRVAILRKRDGRGGSRQVHDRIGVGDIVGVRGPRNTFPLLPAERYQFIAGGIGITPILPMVAAADAAGARWRLAPGARPDSCRRRRRCARPP